MTVISNCTSEILDRAAQALKDGHLVAFPTETVYGLGADATNSKAVARIYSVKGRPADHPLIVHIASIQDLDIWAVDIPEYAIKLAREYWPGPMTLVLKRDGIAKNFITGKQDTVGLRVPDHSIALELLRKFSALGGSGVAAPSANRFGAISPTTSEAVQEELGEYLSNKDLILDGGSSQVGLESTIIDCTGSRPSILRPGAITDEMIKELAVDFSDDSKNSTIRVSGSLESHYSPKAKVILNSKPIVGQGLIALSNVETPEGVIRLSAPKNIDEYAKALYSSLRKADSLGIGSVVAITPAGGGLAEAIRDRLTKAAN